MDSDGKRITKVQIIAAASSVGNIFQMLLCPVYLGMIHVLSVNPTAFARLGGSPPDISTMFNSYWAVIYCVAPMIFIVISISLLVLNLSNAICLVTSGIITAYFLWVTLFSFNAAAIPLLQLSSAVK